MFLANIAQSFRLASSPDGLNSEQKKYFKDLKSGLSYDLTAYYLKDGSNALVSNIMFINQVELLEINHYF